MQANTAMVGFCAVHSVKDSSNLPAVQRFRRGGEDLLLFDIEPARGGPKGGHASQVEAFGDHQQFDPHREGDGEARVFRESALGPRLQWVFRQDNGQDEVEISDVVHA